MAKRTTRSGSSKSSKNADTQVTYSAGNETQETYAAGNGGMDQATDLGAPDLRATAMGSEPSEEDIRARAYRRYLERGGGDGQDFDDWLAAERELKGIR
jgi:hypothetical protein